METGPLGRGRREWARRQAGAPGGGRVSVEPVVLLLDEDRFPEPRRPCVRGDAAVAGRRGPERLEGEDGLVR